MKLFAGSQSIHLAQSISEKLHIPLGKVEYTRFDDSEIKPRILENTRGETCIIIASTSCPVNDSYIELFLLADALKRSAPRKIIAVIPYFGYARQNQQHLPGEPVSAHVMVQFIESVGINEVITLDLHEEQITGFFSIPITHLSALPLLAKNIQKEIIKNEKPPYRIIVISPDQGGVERTRMFRDALEYAFKYNKTASYHIDKTTGIVEKKRNLEKKHKTKAVEITGDIKGKIAVIPDDVIVSGGTLAHAAEKAMEKNAKAIYACATHADFIKKTPRMLSSKLINKILVTDTIYLKHLPQLPNLSIVSSANILTENLQKIAEK